jgi:hypothetical protein
MSSHLQLTRRTDEAFQAFNGLADQLIRSFSPRNVLITGPVVGLFAEALWDRGVPAYCEYVDESTLEQVRLDVKAFCSVGAGSAPTLDYDVVVAVSIFATDTTKPNRTDIDYLKQRSRSVLFVEIGGEYDCNIAASPMLDWIEALQTEGLTVDTAFDTSNHGLNVLLTSQGGDVLTQSHIADFVRMRRLSKSLQRALVQSGLAENEARLTGEKLKRAQDEMEKSQVEKVQVQAQLKDAISNINMMRLRAAQVPATPIVDSEEIKRLGDLVRRLNSDLQAVYSSTCWRLTTPIRAIGHHAPVVTRTGRMAAKLIYWSITLQLPRRLRARREFRRAHGLK